MKKKKGEQEEEMQRRKNVITFIANEDPKLPLEEQLNQDEDLNLKFLVETEKLDANVKKLVRLGRKT